MESVAVNIALLLDGKPSEESQEFCDFSLSHQNKMSLAKGKRPSAPSEFKPIIMETVTYIVAAVLVDENTGDVLMMQEAKSSCFGKWYLPAGRMDPGEDAVSQRLATTSTYTTVRKPEWQSSRHGVHTIEGVQPLKRGARRQLNS